ncbi:MAG: hypothetical protein AB8H86_14070 [Polyangiales bacterium]
MNTTPFVVLALATLLGCSESTPIDQADSALMDASPSDSVSVDARDAGPASDASVTDVPEDALRIRYERDVRPLLEASACGDCHAGVAIDMDYAWISAAGESWCTGDDYERRWNCFEEHARTQTVATGQGCDSDFYHRHGEPCFTEETRTRILGWAAGGYLE